MTAVPFGWWLAGSSEETGVAWDCGIGHGGAVTR